MAVEERMLQSGSCKIKCGKQYCRGVGAESKLCPGVTKVMSAHEDLASSGGTLWMEHEATHST